MSRPRLIKDKRTIIVHVEATLHDKLRESAKALFGNNISELARSLFQKHVDNK